MTKPSLTGSEKFSQGKYNPKNPKKYVGKIDNIIYRSGWEARFMYYLDTHPSILKWSSEEISIPYYYENKTKLYYPDFFIEKINSSGKIQSVMIEIKPAKYTKKPILKNKGAKTIQKYIKESKEFLKNDMKWKSAKQWCADRNIDFLILTEKGLFDGA